MSFAKTNATFCPALTHSSLMANTNIKIGDIRVSSAVINLHIFYSRRHTPLMTRCVL